MRLIPDDAEYPCDGCRFDDTCLKSYIMRCFGCVNITNDEADTLANEWKHNSDTPFSVHLKEFIKSKGKEK